MLLFFSFKSLLYSILLFNTLKDGSILFIPLQFNQNLYNNFLMKFCFYNIFQKYYEIAILYFQIKKILKFWCEFLITETQLLALKGLLLSQNPFLLM